MNYLKDCISVIVPLYKGKKFVKYIIDNIKQNAMHIKNCEVEIIFVNDYPKEKITIIQEKNIEIKLLENKENRGIHASRIEGLNNCKGNYILFLDQDDEINEFFFKECFTKIKSDSNIPFVVCNGIVEHPNYKRMIYKNKLMQKLVQERICYALFDNRILSPGQCLIKRQAIPGAWKKSILKNNGADDMFLWILILSNKKNKKPVLIYKNMYTHKNTYNNASLNVTKMFLSIDEMVDKLENLNMDQNILNILHYRNDLAINNMSSIKINFLYSLIIKYVIKHKNNMG